MGTIKMWAFGIFFGIPLFGLVITLGDDSEAASEVASDSFVMLLFSTSIYALFRLPPIIYRTYQRHERKRLALIEDAHRAYQRRERERLALIEDARRRASSLARAMSVEVPQFAATAGQKMQNSEHLFKEKAFSPFWDELEGAAEALSSYSACIKNIQEEYSKTESYIRTANSKRLGERAISHLPRHIDHSPAEILKLSRNMQNLAQRAQRDFHFASIFQQRRTSQVIVEGFGSLQDAFTQMTVSLDTRLSRISDLLGDIEYNTADIAYSTARTADNTDEIKGSTARTADNTDEIKGSTARTADNTDEIKGSTARTADNTDEIKGSTAKTADNTDEIKGSTARTADNTDKIKGTATADNTDLKGAQLAADILDRAQIRSRRLRRRRF